LGPRPGSAVLPADAPADDPSGASALQADNDNALTGSATSNLSSQTLQALLDLTQQDPGTDPSQASQTGPAQGAHHHHHHHGGGMMRAQSDGPGASTAAAAGNTPSLAADEACNETPVAST